MIAQQKGVLVMSCDVDYGSSGAPVFSFDGGVPRIVSVVSAMAEVEGQKVSLGAPLELRLEALRAELARGLRATPVTAPEIGNVGDLRDIGAKFARP